MERRLLYRLMSSMAGCSQLVARDAHSATGVTTEGHAARAVSDDGSERTYIPTSNAHFPVSLFEDAPWQAGTLAQSISLPPKWRRNRPCHSSEGLEERAPASDATNCTHREARSISTPVQRDPAGLLEPDRYIYLSIDCEDTNFPKNKTKWVNPALVPAEDSIHGTDRYARLLAAQLEDRAQKKWGQLLKVQERNLNRLVDMRISNASGRCSSTHRGSPRQKTHSRSGIEKTPHEHEGDSRAISTAHKARPQSARQDSRKHEFDESERKLVKAWGEGRGDGVRSRPSRSYEPSLHRAYALRPSRPQSAITAREGPGWGSKRDGPGWGSLRAEDLPSNSIKRALLERRQERKLARAHDDERVWMDAGGAGCNSRRLPVAPPRKSDTAGMLIDVDGAMLVLAGGRAALREAEGGEVAGGERSTAAEMATAAEMVIDIEASVRANLAEHTQGLRQKEGILCDLLLSGRREKEVEKGEENEVVVDVSEASEEEIEDASEDEIAWHPPPLSLSLPLSRSLEHAGRGKAGAREAGSREWGDTHTHTHTHTHSPRHPSWGAAYLQDKRAALLQDATVGLSVTGVDYSEWAANGRPGDFKSLKRALNARKEAGGGSKAKAKLLVSLPMSHRLAFDSERGNESI